MKRILVLILICATVTLLSAQVPKQGGVPKPGNVGAGITTPHSVQRVTMTAGSTHKMTYQGVLTYVDTHSRTKIMKKGTYSVRFDLYDDKTAGTVQDSHTYSITSDSKGVYTVTLGEDGTDMGNLSAAAFEQLLWLEVVALTGPDTHVSYPHKVGARVQLTAMPYAMNSQKAMFAQYLVGFDALLDTLWGTTADAEGGFTQWAHHLDASKILSLDVVINVGGDQYVPAGHYIREGFQLEYWWDANYIYLNNTASNSYNIHSTPCMIVILHRP